MGPRRSSGRPFERDAQPMLFLLDIRSDEDRHWLPALEAFLEFPAKPVVKAGRCE
jgi:hypothetical protein